MYRIIILVAAIILVGGCSFKQFSGLKGEGPDQEYIKKLAGEYHLYGVMETDSGILLNEDGTYKFYLIYGAAEEADTGRWYVEDSFIVFNSEHKPVDPQFNYVSSRRENFEGAKITFSGKAAWLATNATRKIFYSGDQQFIAKGMIDKGSVSGEAVTPIDKITIQFFGLLREYPVFKFEPDDTSNNAFEFSVGSGNYGVACFEGKKMRIGSDELFLTVNGAKDEFRYSRVKMKEQNGIKKQ